MNDKYIKELQEFAESRMHEYGIKLPKRKIKWSSTKNCRGKASTSGTGIYSITIPESVIKMKVYGKYYALHELSHIAAVYNYGYKARNHSKEYFKIFLTVCPAKWLKYEIEYKPSIIKHIKKFYCL